MVYCEKCTMNATIGYTLRYEVRSAWDKCYFTTD